MRSKLQKPQLPANFVPRAALNRKLDQNPVVLVSASAGSGKSTAVSAWLDTQPRYLWYRLDAWDNDIDAFFMHLALGVDAVMGTPPELGLQQWVGARSTMGDDTLIRAMVVHLEQLPGPAIWIFDDYHEAANPIIHQLIGQILQHLGPQHKLCLITREDPPIMLAKVRAAGQLSSIREADLRMTVEEAEVLLDPRLSAEQLTFVHERTEGWVAGLQLTGQTLLVTDSVTGFIEAYRDSKDYMMDYLVEEVLARQPEAIRQFLKRTSIFDDFCPDLVDSTLGLAAGESEKILRQLVRSNCFVIPLLDGSWFRYHQLFRELLRQRFKLQTQNQAQTETQNLTMGHLQDLQNLHSRAGAWFEAAGQIQEAIHYYIEGQPLEAARLIESLWPQMDLELRSNAWLNLAQRLPREIVWQSPVLATNWGWALLNAGDLETSMPWINRGEQLYYQKNEEIIVFDQSEYDQLPATILSAKAYFAAAKGDFAQLMALNEALSATATGVSYQRLWVIDTFVATIQWSQGNLDAGIKAMEKALSYSGKDGQHLTTMVCESLVWVIADLQIEKGDLTAAKIALESASSRVKNLSIGPILLAIYSTYLAEIATIRGDFNTAAELLRTGESYGISFDFLDWRQSYEHLLVRLNALQGNYQQARVSIQSGRESLHHNPLPETVSFDDLELMVALYEHEASSHPATNHPATNHPSTSHQQTLLHHHYKTLMAQRQEHVLPEYTAEYKWKLLMRFWDVSVLGPTTEIYALCLELLQRAKAQNRHLHVLDYTLLAARLSPNERTRQHHESSAQQLGVHEHYILPHIQWGMRAWSNQDRSKQANNQLAEPLTNRELEMLQLIANGLSNDQISQQLFITVSTVKGYNNSLYTKLGVKRRTEAILKAKDLGLI